MADDRLKYFEMIQAATSRMAANSFLLKGWSVTLTTAILGLAVKDAKPSVTLVAIVPTLILGGLDAYYLALERSFRRLWTTAVAEPKDAPSFMMSPGPVTLKAWWEAIRRPAVWSLHLPLCLAAVLSYRILS